MTAQPELKHRISPTSIRALAGHLRAFEPNFATRRFVSRASRGLDTLELKARIQHVADALASTLPEDFHAAATIIDGANTLARDRDRDEDTPSLSAFVYWPLCTFVQDHGHNVPARALETMYGLTSLATCEFSIRPYIEQDRAGVFEVLRTWAKDPNHHVRRLVSEGTRPRLPWGPRLRELQADPRPSIALLDTLFNDSELYVRRSVANHLNDISKDHPELAVATAKRWKQLDPSAEVDWVIRHALRVLVKQGHRGALALQGVHRPQIEVLSFSLAPARLVFGDALTLDLQLRAKRGQRLLIDYAVHHMKANGAHSPKVFKWTQKQATAGETLDLQKQHSIRTISTRRYYPGLHRVELMVNGRSFAIRDFELVDVPAR